MDPSFRWLSIFFSFLFSRSVQHITFITWWQDSDSNRFFLCFHCVLCILEISSVSDSPSMAIRNSLNGRFLRHSSVAGARFMSSWFRNIEPAPKDPILGVTEAFLADQSPNKVNVGVVSSPSLFSLCIKLESVDKESEMIQSLQLQFLQFSYIFIECISFFFFCSDFWFR